MYIFCRICYRFNIILRTVIHPPCQPPFLIQGVATVRVHVQTRPLELLLLVLLLLLAKYNVQRRRTDAQFTANVASVETRTPGQTETDSERASESFKLAIRVVARI